MTRKTIALLALIAGASITAGAYYSHRGDAAPELTTAAVTRGTIISAVAATGTLQPVTNVEVGAEVTGIVESLDADFNSMVHKGQVLAKLDQSTFITTLDQAEPTCRGRSRCRTAAGGERAAATALKRARAVGARAPPPQDLQSAKTDARTARPTYGADARSGRRG